MSDYSKESHSKVRRIPDRAHYDEDTIHDIIDSAPICHVSFIQEGRPFVIPCIHEETIHARRTIYLHGSQGITSPWRDGLWKESVFGIYQFGWNCVGPLSVPLFHELSLRGGLRKR